jgi:class 3 adenylate cyclase/tetratricopeptide (TPR) repeat protein
VTIRCPGCGHPSPPDQNFCGDCGAALRPASAPASPKFAAPGGYTPRHLAEQILTSRDALEGERKQLTVLFADLKGSMEALADGDPEEARSLLDPVLALMMEAVHHYEGMVNQVMGDGIMALFGAPITHEDHAVRACYAALRMREGFERFADGPRRSTGVPLQMRVGLNSGEVVVRSIGSDLRMDYSAVGRTTHLAARMEQLATPGSILIAPATLALAEGFIRVQARGPTAVKGLASPIEAYELLGATTAHSRFQVMATRGLTPFVGRAGEVAELERALEQAAAGAGQVVALMGEPGVGKSRLVWEVARAAREHGWLVVEGTATSFETSAVLLPVAGMLRSYFAVEPPDDAAAIRDKVAGRLLALGEADPDVLSPLLSLLDVPVHEASWARREPRERRALTIDAVKRLFRRASDERPLLLVCEDLHWIDGETQAVLDALVDCVPTARFILLATFRPQYEHEWGRKRWFRPLRIAPLGPEHATALLERLLGRDSGLRSLERLLIERTGGNPFFLEECVRSLVESATLEGGPDRYRLARSLERLEIPATVQAMLAARIDRLGFADKRLLQAAAVIGHDVPYAILEAIADQSADETRGGLARLATAGFLDQTRLFPDLQFTFKHALTHEVAYEGLLHARRRTVHAAVVDAIKRLHGERLDDQVEPLAHHAVQGQLWDQAVAWCRRAAARAASRSAYAPAAAHLEQALAALGHLAGTRTTTEQAVDIRLELRELLVPLGEQRRTLDRLEEALPLAETLGDPRRLGRVYLSLATAHWLLGDPRRGLGYGEQALAAAEEIGDPLLRMRGQLVTGVAHHALGDYRLGVRACEATLELLDGEVARDRFGMFPVYARAWLTFCLVQLGDFGRAHLVAHEAAEIARANGRPEPLVASRAALGGASHFRGELADAIEHLERGLALCREAGIGVWLSFLAGHLGHVYALSGRPAEAQRLLDECLAVARTQTRVDDAVWMAWLGEAHLLAGRPAEAQDVATRALEVAREQYARGAEAMVRHLLGEIASSAGPADVAGAHAHYGSALTLAEEIGMQPLVAHCHTGLARLCRRTGDPSAADAHFATAAALYRAMGMAHWLEQQR